MALPALLQFPRKTERPGPNGVAHRAHDSSRAIIDIGSNSIRLAVYSGPDRAPAIIFNEKVMAGLGRSLAKTGTIDSAAMERGLAALRRFVALAEHLCGAEPMCVATAAVRDASNGREFLDRAADLGLSVRLLSGEEEAEASGYGVLSGIPDANGIVADLGGGSLELVRIGHKYGSGFEPRVGKRVSMPLGVLRLPALMAHGGGDTAIRMAVRSGMNAAGWRAADVGCPLYLVGGSWRALARLDMHVCGDDLPVMHQHVMAQGSVARLQAALDTMGPAMIKSAAGISNSRIPHLQPAAALLGILAEELATTALVISSTGLREGLLFQELPTDVQIQDPLLVAAREEGQRLARFPEHGTLIDRWIAPLFPNDQAGDVRLRAAACLLADIAWSANPGFRAERGVEIALHGSWLGTTLVDRYRMAQSLHTAFGGGMRPFSDALPDGCSPDHIAQAIAWGLAIRVGQRLSGGVAEPLRNTRISNDETHVTLHLPGEMSALDGEAVRRRLRQLAQFTGRGFQVDSG